jgi:hypothetical protein
MKQRRFYRSIALLVATQMALSPLAIANTTTPPASQNDTAAKQHWTEGFAKIMQGANQVGQSILSGMQQQVAAQQAQNQMNALISQMNPSNCGQNGQQQQCVSEIFPECNILNTRPNFVEPSDCKNGIDPTDPAAAAKAGALMGFYNHYSQVENIYKNFSLETNATSNVGIGCLNARADQLARSLKKREDEIDNLINKMQKTQDEFKKRAEADRAKIEDAMALLEGEGFRGSKRNGKDILNQNSVDFSKTFNDPACAAVMTAEQFKTMGGKSGLKGLEGELLKVVSKKEGNGFNAQEFDNRKAESLKKDIRRLADFTAKAIEVGNAQGFMSNEVKDLPSIFGLDKSSAFITAIKEQQTEARLKDFEITQEVNAITEGRSANLVESLKNERADFETVLNNWSRDEKNTCLRNQSNINALLSNSLKIIDPSASGAANKFADNSYRTFIKNTLARNDITIEQKMTMIAAEEGKGGNSRYLVNTQAAATVDGEVVKATTRLSPARFIQLHVDNCKNQFDTNQNSKGVSGKDIVTKLREFRNEYSAFQKTLAGKVRNSVVDRLINCNDSTIANAEGVGTCSSKDLSTASPTFCVNRANACATNMRQCFAKAEKQVREVVAKRDQAVGQYKTNIAKNEEDLKKLYSMVEQITSVDGLNIAATLKQGLVLPTENLKFHIDQDDVKYVSGLASMEIKDPDQFFDLMKTNLLSLKAQIAKQNRAVMNGDNQSGLANQNSVAQQGVYGHIANIKQNMENIMGEIQEYKQLCEGAFQAFVQGQRAQRAEAMARQSEQQSEQSEYCNRLNTLTTAPTCDNAAEFDDILSAASQKGDTKTVQNINSFKRFCRNYSSDDNQDVMTVSKFESRKGDIVEFCTEKLKTSVSPKCKELLAIEESCKDKTSPEDMVNCDNLKKLRKDAVVQAHRADGNLSDAELDKKITDLSSSLGENRSAMCSSYNNSEGPIMKAVMETAGTVGQALGSGMGQ